MLGVFEAGFGPGPAIPLYFCERDHYSYVNNHTHALTQSVLLHEGRDGSK